ncbi:hypothetical protein ACWNXI_15090 [Caldibacillus thermoamylovorans]
MIKDNLKRYLPEEVPDHLFTQNKLKRMGLVPTEEHVAFVVYPEQGREYKLYDIQATRRPKRQKGFSLQIRDLTVEQVLQERKRELEVRKVQLSNQIER